MAIKVPSHPYFPWNWRRGGGPGDGNAPPGTKQGNPPQAVPPGLPVTMPTGGFNPHHMPLNTSVAHAGDMSPVNNQFTGFGGLTQPVQGQGGGS